jgi:hypothetical protein
MKVVYLGLGESRGEFRERAIGLFLSVESSQADTPAVHSGLGVHLVTGGCARLFTISDVRKPPA